MLVFEHDRFVNSPDAPLTQDRHRECALGDRHVHILLAQFKRYLDERNRTSRQVIRRAPERGNDVVVPGLVALPQTREVAK